jgi:hypothetical protein
VGLVVANMRAAADAERAEEKRGEGDLGADLTSMLKPLPRYPALATHCADLLL